MTERRFRHDPEEMWWLPEARCIGEDPELFFPIGTSEDALSQVAKAKTVCRGCSVRADCREYAISDRDIHGIWGGTSDEERRAKFGELRPKIEAKMQELNADTEKQLGKILLPHQLERLKQIDLQTKVRYRGASALTGGDVAKALNLTDEQREKLEKRAAEVQEELQTKIKQLQADARKKMLDVLTPDQQAQLDKLMGQQFDLPEQNFGDRFRGRDGRRRGGDQPRQEQSKAGKEAI